MINLKTCKEIKNLVGKFRSFSCFLHLGGASAVLHPDQLLLPALALPHEDKIATFMIFTHRSQ